MAPISQRFPSFIFGGQAGRRPDGENAVQSAAGTLKRSEHGFLFYRSWFEIDVPFSWIRAITSGARRPPSTKRKMENRNSSFPQRRSLLQNCGYVRRTSAGPSSPGISRSRSSRRDRPGLFGRQPCKVRRRPGFRDPFLPECPRLSPDESVSRRF